jgi:hypothetical protein
VYTYRVGERGKGIIKAEDKRHMIDGTTGKLMGIRGLEYEDGVRANVTVGQRRIIKAEDNRHMIDRTTGKLMGITASKPQLKPWLWYKKIASNPPNPAQCTG